MKVEIIAVGNEVVTGHTINTNASTIATLLQTVGLMTKYHTAICDEEAAIKEALQVAQNRAEIIVFTGGLGPTEDDLTKETVCEHLGFSMVEREEQMRDLTTYFEKLGRNMTENNKKQAVFPKEAHILPNDCGTAPGCILTKGKTTVVLLPGPPREMKQMLVSYVLPYFKKQMSCSYETFDIKLFGIGESEMAKQIAPLLGVFEKGVVAPYIGEYEVVVRITAKGKTDEENRSFIEDMKKKIEGCLAAYIFGYNEDTLEEEVKKLLIKRGYEVATVESCTGGLVAGTLVNCSGISSYFKEGIVTYSNEAKMKYVGVKEETLKDYGAVSEQTARQMAEGIKQVAGSQIGLSTTGIAGPDGGTKEKPVGLVYIGIALPDVTHCYKLQLKGTRHEVREKTVKNILFALYKLLK